MQATRSWALPASRPCWWRAIRGLPLPAAQWRQLTLQLKDVGLLLRRQAPLFLFCLVCLHVCYVLPPAQQQQAANTGLSMGGSLTGQQPANPRALAHQKYGPATNGMQQHHKQGRTQHMRQRLL